MDTYRNKVAMNIFWLLQLQLKNKALLKVWIHHIKGKNLPLNHNMQVGNEHYQQAVKHPLLSNECRLLHLAVPFTSLKRMQRKPLKQHHFTEILPDSICDILESATGYAVSRDTSMQTDNSCIFVELQVAATRDWTAALEMKVKSYEDKPEEQSSLISGTAGDDEKVPFDTAFQSLVHCKLFTGIWDLLWKMFSIQLNRQKILRPQATDGIQGRRKVIRSVVANVCGCGKATTPISRNTKAQSNSYGDLR